MGAEGERWRAQVDQHFDFLAAAGFTTVVVSDDQWWETSVTYLSDRVGIKVADSREFNRVEVELLRLVDGQVPPVQVSVTAERIDRVLFDNVVEARRPDRLRQLTRSQRLLRRNARRKLAAAVTLLREVAPDFLRGDTGAVDEGAEIVRARARPSPERPRTAPPDPTPAAYVPNELLSRLVGSRLTSVQFVMDYVQLVFDGESAETPVLTCEVMPRVERRSETLADGDAGYADALRGLIPRVVRRTEEVTGRGLRLELDDAVLVVHPTRAELVGPEIALLRGFEDGAWMCWRPGEESFEDLA